MAILYLPWMACLRSSTLATIKSDRSSAFTTWIKHLDSSSQNKRAYTKPYVCTASSVSNVSVLPLLTWNTYSFMLSLPQICSLAYRHHLAIQSHPGGKKEKQKHKAKCIYNPHNNKKRLHKKDNKDQVERHCRRNSLHHSSSHSKHNFRLCFQAHTHTHTHTHTDKTAVICNMSLSTMLFS